jgi:hypothetical protein
VGGIEYRRNSAERESGNEESWKRTQRGKVGAEVGIYGRRESSEARVPSPSPIGRPLNSGGQTGVLR